MSNGTLAPTHLDQIEDALEERQKHDRRQPLPSSFEISNKEERRQQDRRSSYRRNLK